jgi:hypothetical protein
LLSRNILRCQEIFFDVRKHASLSSSYLSTVRFQLSPTQEAVLLYHKTCYDLKQIFFNLNIKHAMTVITTRYCVSFSEINNRKVQVVLHYSRGCRMSGVKSYTSVQLYYDIHKRSIATREEYVVCTIHRFIQVQVVGCCVVQLLCVVLGDSLAIPFEHSMLLLLLLLLCHSVCRSQRFFGHSIRAFSASASGILRSFPSYCNTCHV